MKTKLRAIRDLCRRYILAWLSHSSKLFKLGENKALVISSLFIRKYVALKYRLVRISKFYLTNIWRVAKVMKIEYGD